jgi:hypothetical protein
MTSYWIIPVLGSDDCAEDDKCFPPDFPFSKDDTIVWDTTGVSPVETLRSNYYTEIFYIELLILKSLSGVNSNNFVDLLQEHYEISASVEIPGSERIMISITSMFQQRFGFPLVQPNIFMDQDVRVNYFEYLSLERPEDGYQREHNFSGTIHTSSFSLNRAIHNGIYTEIRRQSNGQFYEGESSNHSTDDRIEIDIETGITINFYHSEFQNNVLIYSYSISRNFDLDEIMTLEFGFFSNPMVYLVLVSVTIIAIYIFLKTKSRRCTSYQ